MVVWLPRSGSAEAPHKGDPAVVERKPSATDSVKCTGAPLAAW